MNRSSTIVYTHFIWATRDRQGFITPDIEKPLYRYLINKSEELRCWIREIGGTENHIHILVRMAPIISTSKYAQTLKGSSSHYISQIYDPGMYFRWQGGYGAYSVSPYQVPTIMDYIKNQKTHHSKETIKQWWELPPISLNE